jgi:hypothetical protein
LKLLKSIIIILLLAGFCGNSATAQPDSLLFRDFAIQYEFQRKLSDSLIAGKQYDQAISTAHEMEKWADEKGDHRLGDLFQCMRYNISLSIKENKNSYAEEGLLSLLNQIDAKNDQLRAEVLYRLASYYWTIENYARSFEYDLAAYKLYTRIPLAEFPNKIEYLHNLGSRYYHFRDFENAKPYFQQVFHERPGVSSTNTLALCYQQSGGDDSAEHYFRLAYTQAKQEKNLVWQGIIMGNLANLYYQRKNYTAAIGLFEKSVEICMQERLDLNASHAMSGLSLLYLLTGERDKAMATASKGYNIIQNKGYNNSYELIRNAYPKFAKVFAAFGRHQQAYLMLDSANIAKDSANKRANALVFAGVQHKLEAQEHYATKLKHEREEKFQMLVRNGLIGCLLLIAIIAILLINRQRLKYRHTQEQLQVEKLQAKAELLNATSQLEDFMRSISEKNELIEKFSAEVNRMQEQYGAGNYLNEPLLELQRSTILTDDEWNKFQNTFEKVHKGFLKRLKHKVQGLSPVETRFMLLSRLRLSTSEMAAALGISSEAARQNTARLKIKLSLPNEEHSLEDFAASI